MDEPLADIKDYAARISLDFDERRTNTSTHY